GIGAAVCERLRAAGTRVIGVDLRDADVVADLSDAAGRTRAVDGVRASTTDDALDGVVACAGLGPQVADRARLASVHYFGASALLAGPRPLLARGDAPAAVASSAHSSRLVPAGDGALPSACPAGD